MIRRDIRLFMFVGCAVVASALAGCGPEPLPGLNSPEHLILYSIDGRDFQPGEEPKADEIFHDYPVLGRIEVKDADKRKEIVTALKEGVAKSDGSRAACFWPRHAIRVVKKGKKIDYVICFQCLQLRVYGGNSDEYTTVTREPQAVFNKHLKEAGIPLATGLHDDN